MVELDVLRSPDREEVTRVGFYRQRGYRNWERAERNKELSALEASDSLVSLDTSYSSTLPEALSRAPETASVYLGPDETLRLSVFIDRSIVEVFVNGRQCVAARVYPGREDSVGISLRSQGRDAVLESMDVWQMNGIY